MKSNPRSSLIVVALLALSILNPSFSTLRAQGTAFTYQGSLNSDGVPANGLFDFEFSLYPNAERTGTQIGSTVTQTNIGVTNGLFTVTLNFGSVFAGNAAWLAIAVKTNGASGFTVLSPLQELTPTPYAVYSGNAGSVSATGIVGTIPGSNLPPSVITNGQSGANITGNFSGNGGGLTNVTAAALSVPPGMAFIPAGSFTMGDTLDGEADAIPTAITVSAYYMDVNLVSYSQWLSVYCWATNQGYAFDDPGIGVTPNQPIQWLDWYDCVIWCNARSQQAGLAPVYYTDSGFANIYKKGDGTPYANWTANGFRLPTEAEWEKAARGGLSGQRFPWGNVISEGLANYYGDTSAYSYDLGPNGSNPNQNPNSGSTPLGFFAPNGYGLYDMAGNNFQWCWDFYGTPYGQPTTTDPTGPPTGSKRVYRGGEYGFQANNSRCANRNKFQSSPMEDISIVLRCVRRH